MSFFSSFFFIVIEDKKDEKEKTKKLPFFCFLLFFVEENFYQEKLWIKKIEFCFLRIEKEVWREGENVHWDGKFSDPKKMGGCVFDFFPFDKNWQKKTSQFLNLKKQYSRKNFPFSEQKLTVSY